MRRHASARHGERLNARELGRAVLYPAVQQARRAGAQIVDLGEPTRDRDGRRAGRRGVVGRVRLRAQRARREGEPRVDDRHRFDLFALRCGHDRLQASIGDLEDAAAADVVLVDVRLTLVDDGQWREEVSERRRSPAGRGLAEHGAVAELTRVADGEEHVGTGRAEPRVGVDRGEHLRRAARGRHRHDVRGQATAERRRRLRLEAAGLAPAPRRRDTTDHARPRAAWACSSRQTPRARGRT